MEIIDKKEKELVPISDIICENGKPFFNGDMEKNIYSAIYLPKPKSSSKVIEVIAKVQRPIHQTLVFSAAIFQMIAGAVGLLAFYKGWNIYKLCPHWGPVIFLNEGQVQMWFMIEYVFGLLLLILAARNGSWTAFTIWLWACTICTATTALEFVWDHEILIAFDNLAVLFISVHTIFHLTMILLVRNHVKKTFGSVEGDIVLP